MQEKDMRFHRLHQEGIIKSMTLLIIVDIGHFITVTVQLEHLRYRLEKERGTKVGEGLHQDLKSIMAETEVTLTPIRSTSP